MSLRFFSQYQQEKNKNKSITFMKGKERREETKIK